MSSFNLFMAIEQQKYCEGQDPIVAIHWVMIQRLTEGFLDDDDDG